jgi:predicted MPP superfamily phosphohydrolase
LVNEEIREALNRRLGPPRAGKRIALESDTRVGHSAKRLRLLGFWLSPETIRTCLQFAGLYRRGLQNASAVRVRHSFIDAPIPDPFDEFTILHISDLHIDMNPGAVERIESFLPHLSYDLCVMTGDYRGKSSGPFETAIKGMADLRTAIDAPVYAVLGDHDTIYMVPALERIGIHMLLNEAVTLERDGAHMHLAGIDEAGCFHADDIGKAASGIPGDEFSILLSHTPEVYRQAAKAGFKLLLSGHTHGGQICLPGGFPVTLQANVPRRMGAGAWKYEQMLGYTSTGAGSSVVPVRFNCPPEITLHHLRSVASERPLPNV